MDLRWFLTAGDHLEISGVQTGLCPLPFCPQALKMSQRRGGGCPFCGGGANTLTPGRAGVGKETGGSSSRNYVTWNLMEATSCGETMIQAGRTAWIRTRCPRTTTYRKLVYDESGISNH